jgi:hypothetical protein
MLEHRRRNVPAMPNNIRELAERIRVFEPMNQFYRGVCRGEGRIIP